MIEEFKIYIDRLKDGSVQKVEGAFDPTVLGVAEEHLQFLHPITIDGEAYTTDDHLVINLSAETFATMPCSICSESTTTSVSCDHAYITVPLEEIKGAVYDFGHALREGLLIEVPHATECHEGNCPGRKTLEHFFRVKEENVDKPTHSPFKNIDLDQ
jgi:hypothetical protein